MTRETRLMPAGIPRYVRVYDNGGETVDRYTVVYTGRYRHKTGGEYWCLGMSAAPYHPQGFGQHSETRTAIDTNRSGFAPAIGRRNHLGRRIEWTVLPADCKRCALETYRDLWNLTASVSDGGR